MNVYELATEIMELYEYIDPYEYGDCVGDDPYIEEQVFETTVREIKRGGYAIIDDLLEYDLCEDEKNKREIIINKIIEYRKGDK